MLTQRALTQRGAAAWASSHSLMSEEGEYKEQGGLLRAGDLGAQDSSGSWGRVGGAGASGLKSNVATTTGWLCEPGQAV